MKLISEYTENKLDFLIEKDEKSGKKKYAIQGIFAQAETKNRNCLLYTSPSPRDAHESRMPSSA